uniref:Uncharacterized protein n=1 Tax=Romanomermis culicivorax TaxID=13658 RepID=A0A915J931_ROMCU
MYLFISTLIFCTAASDITTTNQPLICLGHCGQSCTTCSDNYTYQCADGTCISLAKYKNHIIECPDGTDEAVGK